MGYSPTLGRFLERDPIGDPNTSGPSKSQVALDAEQQARDNTADTFEWAHKNDRWLWEYTDGMNSYEFVGGNPVTFTDPSGMDRYISNGNIARGQFHQGVAVDLWEFDPKTMTYKKVGVATYDFSVDWNCTCWPLGIFLAPGKVVKTTGLNLDEPAKQGSTPQEDIEMHQWLELQLQDANFFSVLGGNTCRAWSKEAMHKGIKWYKEHSPWDG